MNSGSRSTHNRIPSAALILASLCALASCSSKPQPKATTSALESPNSAPRPHYTSPPAFGDEGPIPPAQTPRFQLAQNIATLQDRVENFYRPEAMGRGIVNLDSEPTGPSSAPLDVEAGDSALWTGVYLGAQCLKYPTLKKQADRDANAEVIRDALRTLELYQRVTGVPGLISRYVYRPGSSNFPDLSQDSEGKARNCFSTAPFADGAPPLANYKWCGLTSRDQYHGFLFGLTACQNLVNLPEIRLKTAQMSYEIISELQQHKWIIPYGKYELIWPKVNSRFISGVSQIAFASLGLSSIDILLNSVPEPALPFGLREKQIALKKDLESATKEFPILAILEQPWTQNFFEYYGHNLTALATYIWMKTEKQPERLNLSAQYFTNNIWRHTWTHSNAQFTFMKVALLGRGPTLSIRAPGSVNTDSPSPTDSTSPNDVQAIIEAKEALITLTEKRNQSESGTALASNCEEDPEFLLVRKFLTTAYKVTGSEALNKAVLESKLPTHQCAKAQPVRARPDGDYLWQLNPFQQSQTSRVYKWSSPGVDALLGYWLGRSSGAVYETD